MKAEQLRAILLVALVVAAPIVGVGLFSSSASAAPSGFVAIPESNISSDLPEQTPMGQAAQAIADAGVLATDHGETLEVTVTSPGRAKNLFDGPVYGGGPIAIVLTDDEEAAGRTVALPAAELEAAIGYTPILAYGTHDDGTTYRITVTESESGKWLLVDIPHFSTNSITFAGTSQISATPATDGASFSYDVSDKSSVSNFQINVTGYDATEWDNETGLGIGGTSSTATSDSHFSNAPTTTNMSVSGTGDSAVVQVDGRDVNQTFTYTGAEQTFDVPSGASSLTVYVWGAEGGDSAVEFSGATASGGLGGYVEGTLSVTGGETLRLYVGGAGGTGGSSGGWNGGGSGQRVTESAEWADSGGGGGASDIRQGGATLGDRVAVAGGGGGAGAAIRGSRSEDAGGGGKGGADTGQDGGDATGSDTFGGNWNANGGGGGSQSSGGAGGSASHTNDDTASGSLTDGNSGSSGNGADGVTDKQDTEQAGASGAGGGGYYGGGSGAVALGSDDVTSSGGGGAGSNYDDGLASVASNSRGVDAGESGNGKIIITEPNVPYDTGNYTGVNHTVSGPTTGYTDLTLTDATATVTWQEWTGSSWSDVNTGTFSTTGNHSVDISSASSGKLRVQVDMSTSSSSAVAEIEDTVAEGDGGRSVAVAGNADPIGPGASGEVTVEVTGNADGKGATPSSVSVSADTGGSASYGDLTDGETVEKEVPLTSSTSSLTFDFAGGSVDYTLKMQEVAETVDPQVEVNGNTTGGATVGTLADGTTTSLTADKDWITEGTNQVNVSVGDGSLTADAPTPSVTLNYTHEASLSKTVSYDGEKWTERYNVSRTWGSDTLEANLTIPFNDNAVVEIRGIETKTNSGSWSSVSSSSYSLDGTTLTVDLGSVDKNDETHVRANGSKVAVSNGSITVLTAAAEGTEEKTEFSIASKSSGFYIDVGGSDDDRVQYLSGETWDSPAEYSRFTSNGAQELHLPNAAASDSATIETLDSVDVNPKEGAVKVTVTDATAPEIDVEPGALDEEQVDYTYYGAETGKTVVLYSITEAIARATGVAESPVTLTDDDSAETFDFRIETSGGGSGGGGGGGGVALGNPSRSIGIEQVVLALLLVAGLVGAAIAARRYAPEETDLGRRGAIVLAAAGFVAILLAVEVLQPGTISNAIASSLEPILSFAGILAVIGAAVVGGLAIREWWRRRQEEREGEPVTLRLQR